jgi:L-ascorbate metabolism protein UlaG (beta-lactamase superfamily)
VAIKPKRAGDEASRRSWHTAPPPHPEAEGIREHVRIGMLACIALVLIACGCSPVAAACRDQEMVRGFMPVAHAASDAMLQYFGHNFFQITTDKGTKIVTDPLAPGMYPTPSLAPHAMTIGREHPNHNYVQLAQGNPLILRGLAANGTEWNRVRTKVREVSISNIPIYQNGVMGAIKGSAFLFELETLCIVHLGDLSHTLTPEQLQQIGRVDVALVPISGVYTMGPETAREVLQQLQPKIAIPMHYRNNLALVDTFVQGLPTRRLEGDTLLVSKASLPIATEIVVLRPFGTRQ